MAAPVGLTGVNFAVAETGAIVVVTNEGNADLVTSLPDVHIAVMGVEKVIRENARPLGLPAPAGAVGDRPARLGLHHRTFSVRGRARRCTSSSSTTAGARSWRANGFIGRPLCLRCGACLNTCPVFRRSGGHSYNYIIPGPIGTILAPHRDLKKYKDMPFASSLCGSCSAVCPVKVDLHRQIVLWRNEVAEAGQLGRVKSSALKAATAVMKNTRAFAAAGALARKVMRLAPGFLYNNRLTIWGRTRDLPKMPAKSFRAQYKKYRKTGKVEDLQP